MKTNKDNDNHEEAKNCQRRETTPMDMSLVSDRSTRRTVGPRKSRKITEVDKLFEIGNVMKKATNQMSNSGSELMQVNTSYNLVDPFKSPAPMMSRNIYQDGLMGGIGS